MTGTWHHIEGGVTAPKGYRAAGFAAAIKPGSTKKDCALVASDKSAAAAGAFTKNLFKAPPVQWTEQVVRHGRMRAVFVNSGNANACTGEQGFNDARATAERIAGGLEATPEEIGVLSTGVIGVTLPMDRISNGVDGCLRALSPEGSIDAARAIMTTDTVPKERAVEIHVGGGKIRIGAIAKGSGMISPNMATMICVVTTDAKVSARTLKTLVKDAVQVSFNQMCVDTDMSTSDSVICMANGAAGLAEIKPDSPEFPCFKTALTALFIEMAKALVKDGEGATKLVEIQVTGTNNDNDAKTIARAIANSQLCKTAFYGGDPNWGRIACAAGYSGVKFDTSKLSLWLDDVMVMTQGMPANYEEVQAAARMKKPEFIVRLNVGDGTGQATFWTSDLSYKYVEINADYRT
jgi:glutamate N-acetyltransferase/amino-acid N-acetyltransferase